MEEAEKLEKKLKAAGKAFSLSQTKAFKSDVFDPRGEEGLTATEALRRGIKVFEYGNGKDKDKGPTPTTIEDTIKDYRRQMATEQALMSLTGQRRREEELFLELKYANQDADIKTSESRLRNLAEEMAAMEERSRVIQESRRQQRVNRLYRRLF